MRISDWSSDVCSSDLEFADIAVEIGAERQRIGFEMADGRNVEGDLPGLFADDRVRIDERTVRIALQRARTAVLDRAARFDVEMAVAGAERDADGRIRFPEQIRSEEHTSELQSLMRISS